MPPKKNEPSKKTIEKQKQKVIEDKTFGLKNKKGAKTQKYIAQVEKQVVHGNKSAREIEKAKADKENKKEEKKKELEELNSLFKPVADLQKIDKGVDPKSVLCVFFKQNLCKKGDKCKFSHDLNIARKGEKRSLYSGDANGEGSSSQPQEGMESWDQAQLEDVVNKKHGEKNKGLPPTSIICKYFLDAVENNKYGWFWECPNGETCHYKHALPAGFILKKDRKKMEEQQEVITLEELIEKERMALGPNQTKVTLETFMKWKKRKRAERLAKLEEEKAKKAKDFKQGRIIGISGREMFEFNPDLVVDELDEEGGDVFDSRLREGNPEDDYDGPVHEINLDDFEVDYEDMDTVTAQSAAINGVDTSANMENVNTTKPFGETLEIDEELFKADGLDELDEELETLTLEH